MKLNTLKTFLTCCIGLHTSSASALDWLSIGSAHASDVRMLKSNNNGLQHVDFHMHNCAFKYCFNNKVAFEELQDIMDTRHVMTKETDQEQYLDWEKSFYANALANNNGKLIGNYVTTVRPNQSSWQQSMWKHSPRQGLTLEDAHAIPSSFLETGNTTHPFSLHHHIPSSASPSSAWTPYQQSASFPWGNYLNINSGVTFDMPGHMYLDKHVPPALAYAGWSPDAWANHIKHMFNLEQGKRWVHINMTGFGDDDVTHVKAAMSKMLEDGLLVDGFIVVNFGNVPYNAAGAGFVADMNIIKDHFNHLRQVYG